MQGSQGEAGMKRVLLLVSTAFFTAAYICGPISDSEIWLHIALGRKILSSDAVPQTDLWNRFSSGQSWQPYSWMFDVIAASVWNCYAAAGMIVLKLVLAMLFVSVLMLCLVSLSESVFAGAVTAVVAAMASYAHFGLAPHVLGWVCFSLTIALAFQIRRQARLTPGSCIALAAVFAFWTNLHPSVLFGLIGLFSILCGKDKQSGSSRLWLCAAVCLGAITISPALLHGPAAVLTRLAESLAHRSMLVFQPASFDLYPVSFLILLLAVLFTLLHYHCARLGAAQLVALTFFVIVGMASITLLPFAVIYAASLIAWTLPQASSSIGAMANLSSAATNFERTLAKVPPAVAAGLLLLFFCLKVDGLLRLPLVSQAVPKAAADFVLESDLEGPILNSSVDGAYLIFRFSDESGNPTRLVSVDSRVEINDPRILALHDGASQGMATWREFFRRVQPKVVIWPTDTALSSILAASSSWCRATESEGWNVYLLVTVPTVPFSDCSSPQREGELN